MKEKKRQAEEYGYLGYSYAFKKQVIEEIENGQISMNQSSIKYHIGRSTIQRWFDKMGNFEKRLKAMGGRSAKQEIQLLRRQLKVLEQQNDILNFALDMVEEESGVDMRKKYLPESLISTKKKGESK
jgi:transposase-like protein